ncbi:voltage-gated chloride channel [Aureococcus anophagefferens]|nr:voltage-gated chloride channel [Aureococcus anophagefferens]
MVTICLCLAGVVGATDLLREGRERAERYARCDRPANTASAGDDRGLRPLGAELDGAEAPVGGGAVYVKNQKSGTHFVESLLGGPARWYYQKFRSADPAAAWFANARFEREASRDPRSAALGCDARAPPPAVFTVVRDPFESFASAFLEAMCVERDGRGTFAGNRKPEFAAFAAPPRSGEGPSMTMSHDNATRLFEQYVADVRRGARMSRLFIHGWPRAPGRERGATQAHRVDAAPPGCGGLRFIFALETAGDAIAQPKLDQ